MSRTKFIESMNASWAELEEYIDTLEKEKKEAEVKIKTLEDKLEALGGTDVEIFDPVIHTKKPARPMTKVERTKILELHQNEYVNESGSIKSLDEFFSRVNAEIAPTASKTEIQGVIYNKFDERLYL